MLKDQQNAEMLQLVEESIATLYLDGKGQLERFENKAVILGEKCGDRWFDKTASYSVDENSLTSMISETVETTAVIPIELTGSLEKLCTELPKFNLNTGSGHSVREVKFNIDSDTANDIVSAISEYDMYKESFHTEFFLTSDVKRKEFTKRSISPDAIVHIGMHSSLMDIHGHPRQFRTPCLAPTYLNSYPEFIYGPSYQLINIVKKLKNHKRIEIEELQSYSREFTKKVYEMRSGVLAEEHLFSLEDIAKGNGKKCDFFNSQEYQDAYDLFCDCATVQPQEWLKSATLFAKMKGNLAFAYLFHHDKLSGCVSGLTKEGACVSEFAASFLDTVEQVQWHVTK